MKNPYPRWGKRDGGTEIFFYYTPFFSICKRSGLLQQKQPLQEFHTLGQHGFVIKAELRGVELRRISHTQQEKQARNPLLIKRKILRRQRRGRQRQGGVLSQFGPDLLIKPLR